MKVRRRETSVEEGEALRRSRKAAGLSFRQMARALHVSVVELSAMEQGRQSPPKDWRETAMGLRG